MKNISKSFGDVEAVKGLNFCVESGQLLSLLGPSGCGKTTTLRIIAGLDDQDDGQVLVGGSRIDEMPVYRREVGFVFQNYALFPHMTVGRNIQFGLKMKKSHKSGADLHKKVKEALELVDLKGYEERMPENLSGGEKQRVSLARTLVLDLKVVLLDEPLASLDAKLRKQMRIELKRIQKELGVTMIYVTHNQEEALSMSDKIVLMVEGEEAQTGSPFEVYQKPRSTFVANFMGQVNCFSGEVVDVSENSVEMKTDCISSVKVTPEKDESYSIGQTLFFLIRKEGLRIERPKEKENSKYSSNSVKATVDAVAYLGSETEYICSLGEKGKEQLSLRAPITEKKGETYARGQEVKLSWEASDLYIIGSEGKQL